MISTDRLTRRFGALCAVNALTLEVAAGEVFGLVGRNGAGKTTTIKMLSTLLPPTSGSASIAGYDVVARADRVRRVIGYVPQALSADGELTGYENLLVFARLYDIPRAERRARIAEALRFMDLEEAAGRLVRSYSGGMIRRLEIAQSTLHRPKVLFLDEPTVGLDPLARRAVWEHVRRLNRELAPPSCSLRITWTRPKRSAAASPSCMPERSRRSIRRKALRAGSAPGATLDGAFAHFTGGESEQEGRYEDTSVTRRTAGRLG